MNLLRESSVHELRRVQQVEAAGPLDEALPVAVDVDVGGVDGGLDVDLDDVLVREQVLLRRVAADFVEPQRDLLGEDLGVELAERDVQVDLELVDLLSAELDALDHAVVVDSEVELASDGVEEAADVVGHCLDLGQRSLPRGAGSF